MGKDIRRHSDGKYSGHRNTSFSVMTVLFKYIHGYNFALFVCNLFHLTFLL